MPRNISSEMGLPGFRGAVREIILASTAIYVVILLLVAFEPRTGQLLISLGRLDPESIRQGWLWQLVTYAFIYVDPIDFVLSLVGIYFLGTAVQDRIGRRGFYRLFFGTVILSALAGIALSLTRVMAQGAALGSGAAANAILMVFYLLNRDALIMPLFVPLRIPVKWMVLFVAIIETAYLLLHQFALFDFILLLGLGAGYVWYQAFLARRVSLGLAERFYGLRNAYYRWKRRRAARKFEVYMRGHDRQVTFDEHGNYIPPDEAKKTNGGEKSGWVN